MIIVSGLPRSGTSLMMQMLSSGGIPLVTDGIREADTNNLKGYYEYEAVKKLAKEKSWLYNAKGKVVKIVSHFLKLLPSDLNYDIIFMLRDLDETLSSQRKMMKRLGTSDDISNSKMKNIFNTHIDEVKEWLALCSNINVTYVNYIDCIYDSGSICKQISDFLNMNLKIENMQSCVDSKLYRNRNGYNK